MDNNKLKEFNSELKSLLNKYGVNLQIAQNIVVVPTKIEEVEEKTPATEDRAEVNKEVAQ